MSDWTNYDDKPKRKRDETPDPQAVWQQVDQELNRFGIDLDLDKMGINAQNAQVVTMSTIDGGPPVIQYAVQRRGVGCGCLISLLTMLSILAIFVVGLGTAFVPQVARALSPLFCDNGLTFVGAGDVLQSIEGAVNSGSGEPDIGSVFTQGRTPEVFSCVDALGVSQGSAVERYVTVLIILSLAPFVLAFIGVFVRLNSATRQFSTPAVMTTYSTQVGMPPATGSPYRSSPPPLDSFFTGADSAAALKDRLKQLQDAYDAGLLTREEYDRKRQEILSDI